MSNIIMSTCTRMARKIITASLIIWVVLTFNVNMARLVVACHCSSFCSLESYIAV